MSARVFIVEPYGRVDVRPAAQYGEIVYMFPVDGDRPPIFDKEFPTRCLDRLEALRFDPAEDYVLVAGNMTTVCRALCTVAHHYADPLRLLMWNAKDQEYIVTTGSEVA